MPVSDPPRYLTLPNVLSLIRLLLVPVFLFLLIASSPAQPGVLPANAHHLDQLRWLALGVFAVMAVTDKLDGYLARAAETAAETGAAETGTDLVCFGDRSSN